MDISSDPFLGALGSSPPTTDSMDLVDTITRAPSPTLPPIIDPTLPPTSTFTWEPSSDPLASLAPIPTNFSKPAGPYRLSRNPTRKRGPSSSPLDTETHTHKEPRTEPQPNPNQAAKDLVLQARDLLVQAYSLTSSRDEQARLLDLVEIFREYAKKGTYTSRFDLIGYLGS